MINKFFWFDECMEQVSMIYQWNFAEIFGWIHFNIFEWYIHIYTRFFFWTLKLDTKDFDKIANHWFICWYQQMQIQTPNDQIFKINCWSRTKYKNEFWKNCCYLCIKNFNVSQICMKLFWFDNATDQIHS